MKEQRGMRKPKATGKRPGTRLVAGCMSGTSLDGIDTALVRVHGVGLSMRIEVVRTASGPLGKAAGVLARLARGDAATASEIVDATGEFSRAHVAVLSRLLRGQRPDFLSIHGQTVHHRPPLSWQLLQPAPIAVRFGCPVVCDLRAIDLALDGQGAPLTPIADFVLFRGDAPTAVVNLGGFCNVTLLPEAIGGRRGTALDRLVRRIAAQDVCACNQVLDEVSRIALRKPFDAGGRAALRGVPDPAHAASLIALLDAQRVAGRSLGSGDELADFTRRCCAALSPTNACATAAFAVALVISRAVAGTPRILLAGGGVKNAGLVRYLRGFLPGADVTSTADAGVAPIAREAVAWAALGALSADGVPVALPHITGARGAAVAGSWVYPHGGAAS